MNALLNAHTKRGCDSPPHIGFASNVSPEAQSSQTGVSSEYVQQEGYNWFVLRATYNRVNAAVEKAKKNDMEKPRDFDPFGQTGFAHLWLQYDCPFKVLVLGVNFILPF